MDNEKNYMDNEIWKVYKITRASNKYVSGKRVIEISNLGRIRINGEIHTPKLFRKRSDTDTGYYIFDDKFLHRIVATLFIPNPDNKPEIDHINAIKTDNRVENLRWVTHSENMLNTITLNRNIEKHIGKAYHTTPHSEESKRKMSAAHKGHHHKMPEAAKEKIRQARLEYWKKKKGGN